MKRRLWRACVGATFAIATAVSGLGSTATAAPMGSANPSIHIPSLSPHACAPNIVVSVPGGVNSDSWVPDNLPHGLYTRDIGQQLRLAQPGRVVDRYASFDSIPGAIQSYEQTRRAGYNVARGLIARDSIACPDAKFSIVGYSLGADIASRLVGDIAHGHGPIPEDRLASAVLIANPNRGVDGVADRGGAPRSTAGAFGALPGGYGAVTDRVLEVCRKDDIVCDTPRAATPVARKLAKAALLTGTNIQPALKAFASLPPASQVVALPELLYGSLIHIDYEAVNGSGIARGFIHSRLA